jgi:glycosyltransferase involved in cell wall biosynthesis
VLAQDFADFEIVVVDDGSADATADIVESIADERIRSVRLPANRGNCAARNEGIRAARAPLICFLDSDDRFLPHKLGFVARFFAGHPGIDVLIDSFEVFFPAATGKAPAPRRNPELRDSAAIESAVFSRELWKATPAVSARREALFAAGLFDETLRRRVDMDLVLRLARTARCASTSTVLWCKHWTDDSISAADDTFIPALVDICRRHPQYVTRSEWRVGMARDIARHLLRQAAGGHAAQLGRDVGRLRRHFGAGTALRLFVEGVGEIIRRGRSAG